MPRYEDLHKIYAPAGTLGSLLAATRRRQGISIATMASRAGLSVTFVDNVERGKRSVDPNRIPDLARAYNIPPEVAAWSWIVSDRKSTRLNSSHLGISYAVF